MKAKTNTKPLKLKLKTGDTVIVIAGNNKGKSGTIKSVDRFKNRAIVEGVNMVTKHVKPDAQNPQGGEIKKMEAPIHISNLAYLDSSSNKAVRIGRKPDTNGKLKRYNKATGEFID